jgi:uncharacterized protein (DUF885 family)
VYLEALVRVTRLTVAIGLHAGGMRLAEAVDLFRRDAFLTGAAARAEAGRGLFEPTYGRYTWGKLAINDLTARAHAAQGPAFRRGQLHRDLLALGSPPIGLLSPAIDVG